MSTITKFIFIAALLLSIVVPTAAFLIGEKNRGRFKTTLGINCFLFFGTMAFAVIMIFTGDGSVALAADTASGTGSRSSRQYGIERNRIRIPSSSTFNRSFLRRWWYRRCKRSKFCSGCYQ